MGTHHRQEGGILHPPHENLPVAQILCTSVKISHVEPGIPVAIWEETAHISRPVRLACSQKVQPFRDMTAKCLPVCADVTAPGDGCIPMLPSPGGSGQAAHALVPVGAALALPYSPGMIQADLSWVEIALGFVYIQLGAGDADHAVVQHHQAGHNPMMRIGAGVLNQNQVAPFNG